MPSRTFIRTVTPTDILDVPELRHPRISLDVRVTAPLFIGGATVEGRVVVVIDGGKSKSRRTPLPAMSIGRITVDVVGVESSHGKHFIFRTLASELVDAEHPPPAAMSPSRIFFDAFWEVDPSSSELPFCIDLPVNIGPPPYKTKRAGIRYVLCVTLTARVSERQCYARRSTEIPILSVHDRMWSSWPP
jgi:hypothetical protein